MFKTHKKKLSSKTKPHRVGTAGNKIQSEQHEVNRDKEKRKP
jgi:hypothetical protein